VRRRRGVYITGEFFVGPLIALIGWGFAQLSGVLWPLTCLGVGAGPSRAVRAAPFAPPAAPARARLDPLDTIARLAQLRDAGAITEAEFEREKAKLLDQI
jgi:hypothetical protein